MAAYPIAKPARPCSLSGVLKTRSRPNASRRSTVHRNTPPNATSSPNTTAVGSAAIATRIASLTAVKRFMRRVFVPGAYGTGGGGDAGAEADEGGAAPDGLGAPERARCAARRRHAGG